MNCTYTNKLMPHRPSRGAISRVTLLAAYSRAVSTRFRLRTSGDPEAAVAGCAEAGIVLSHRAEVSLLDWIPVDSCLCAVRLATSVKESHKREVDRCLFIVSAYTPTDCSCDVVKDRFYDALNALLRRAKSSNMGRILRTTIVMATCWHSPGAPGDVEPWTVKVEPRTASEAHDCICSLKRHRASGPDDLPPALFKDESEVLSQRLSDLFACIWEKESVPDNWGESVIVPIFKKGARSENGNRRISLTPVVATFGVTGASSPYACEENLVGLEYTDDIALIFEEEKAQGFLDELPKVI
ncbi:hypothetical protein CLF_103345, partial [Clonorchis sinensis]